MIYGMTLSAYGGLMQEFEQEVLANNIANMNTVGYRSDVPLFTHRPPSGDRLPGGGERTMDLFHGIGGGPLLTEVHTLDRPGHVSATQRPLDLAIEGNGFFSVADSQGEIFYTRAGDFQLASDGLLTTSDGKYRVMGEGFTDLQLPPGEEITISRDGQVSAGGRLVGTLAVVDFQDRLKLVKVGDNLYRHRGTPLPVEADGRVLQGYLESSAVNAMEEMVRMIRAGRMYEMNLQMLRTQDQLLQRTVVDIAAV
jgi:flagellar basal body rod protein FlgG